MTILERIPNPMRFVQRNTPKRNNNVQAEQAQHTKSESKDRITQTREFSKPAPSDEDIKFTLRQLEAFSKSDNKSEFSLEGHNLGSSVKYWLGEIRNAAGGALKTLNLSNCKLDEPLDLSPLKGSGLKTLIMQNNKTKSIIGLETVPDLEKLDLSNTSVATSKAPQASKYIVDIAEYAGAKKLNELSLANSGLTGVTGLDAFKDHRYIKTIDLIGNPISEIPNGLFSLHGPEIHMGTRDFSDTAKIEYDIALLLNPGHNVHIKDVPSSGLNTRLTLNGAKTFADTIIHGIEALEQKLDKMGPDLKDHLAQQTEMQTTIDRINAIDTLFKKWESHDNTNAHLTATARYRHVVKATAENWLRGATSLQPVPGRPDVKFERDYNKPTKAINLALQAVNAAGSSFPGVSAAAKAAGGLLEKYVKRTADERNRAISQAFEQHEIGPFCEAFSLGSALMKMGTLGEMEYNLGSLKEQKTDKKPRTLSRIKPRIDEEIKQEKYSAGDYAAKALLALAFGDAFDAKVSQEEAALRLRGMTIEDKVETALRYSCKQQGILFKSHLLVCRPSEKKQIIVDRMANRNAILHLEVAPISGVIT